MSRGESGFAAAGLLAGIAVLATTLLVAPASRESDAGLREIVAGRYTLRFLGDPEVSFIDSLVVLDRGEAVFETAFLAFGFMAEKEPGDPDGVLPLGLDADVTGDGRPDFVLRSYSGGAHCCFTTLVLEREPELRLAATFDGGNAPVEFVNLDDDPALEARLLDWTFAYWNASFAESPAPRVLLDFRDGTWSPSADLMRGPAPGDGELAELARTIRERMTKDGAPSPALWGPMLDFIYAGRGEAALRLFDTAWPGELPGRDAFLLRFGAQLASSPYAKVVSEMNGWGFGF